MRKATFDQSNDPYASNRKHPRRSGDYAMCVINGQPYPIENWSMGGAFVFADGRLFSVGDGMDITLRFKIRGQIINIKHHGVVVRKAKDGIAVQFDPLTQNTHHKMQNIVSDVITAQFADSQNV